MLKCFHQNQNKGVSYMNEDKENKNSTVYQEYIESFQHNINALRDYTRSVSPILDQKLKNSDVEVLLRSISIMNTIRSDSGLMEKILEQSETKEGYDTIEDFLRHNNIEVNDGSYAITGPNRMETKSKIENFYLNISQKGILYQSTLINLVVFFEILIGKLIKQRLLSFPGSGGIENKSLTLSEINSLGTMENAFHHLIDSEVESIMRKKYEDWIEYFKKNMNIKTEVLDQNNNLIVEITQRRNLFVHNEGIVNSIYLKKVDPSLSTDYKLGSKIKITDEYLYKSIDLIEHVGIILAFEAWMSIDKKSEERVNFVHDIGYQYLEDGRWELAKDIYNFIHRDKASTSKDKSISNINIWLCVKRLGKFDSIREEVVKADYSDKESQIKLSYYALLGTKEKVFRLLDEVLKNISQEEEKILKILSWPVLDEYKEEDEYIAISENYNKVAASSDDNEDVTESLDDEDTEGVSLDKGISVAACMDDNGKFI